MSDADHDDDIVSEVEAVTAYHRSRTARTAAPTGPRDVRRGDRWLVHHFSPEFKPWAHTRPSAWPPSRPVSPAEKYFHDLWLAARTREGKHYTLHQPGDRPLERCCRCRWG